MDMKTAVTYLRRIREFGDLDTDMNMDLSDVIVFLEQENRRREFRERELSELSDRRNFGSPCN